jgi:hypothetical protein
MLFQILIFTAQIILTYLYESGLGKTDDLTMEQMIHIYKFQWIWVVPGSASSIFSRISMAILLGRIFSVKTWFRWYLISAAFISSCCVSTVIIVLLTECRPIEALWNPVVAATAHCLDPSIWNALGIMSQGNHYPKLIQNGS